MIEMRSPDAGDLERQKELWRLCFGDADGYVEEYYKNRYRAEETLVLKEGGVVQSMLAGLPMALRSADGRFFPGRYVYALATHPESRGEGFGGFLLKYADYRFQEENMACALVVPAEPSLHSYFARAGFREAFVHSEWDEENANLNRAEGAIREASPVEYNRVRNQLLHGHCYVACDEEAVALQKSFSRISGGDIYLLELPEGVGCASAERVGERILVKELLVPDAAARSAAALIAAELPAKSYRFRVPAFHMSPPESKVVAFGMLKWYLPEDKVPDCTGGFLGLAYD